MRCSRLASGSGLLVYLSREIHTVPIKDPSRTTQQLATCKVVKEGIDESLRVYNDTFSGSNFPGLDTKYLAADICCYTKFYVSRTITNIFKWGLYAYSFCMSLFYRSADRLCRKKMPQEY